MTAAAVLLVLLLILMISRIRVTVVYDGAVRTSVRFLFLKFDILTGKRKKKSAPKDSTPLPKKSEKRKATDTKKEPIISSPTDVAKLVKFVVFRTVRRFAKYLRVDKFKFHITVATPDAARTAVTYGAVSSSAFALTEGLRRCKMKRNAQLEAVVIPDFVSEKSSADIDIVLSIMLWQAVACIITAANGFARYYTDKQRRITVKEK